MNAILMNHSPAVFFLTYCIHYDKLNTASTFNSLTGYAAVQLTPVAPTTDFVDASEVNNLIQSKGYFKGSSGPWNNALDCVMQHNISLSALGGLICHLSRLMVCLHASPFNFHFLCSAYKD